MRYQMVYRLMCLSDAIILPTSFSISFASRARRSQCQVVPSKFNALRQNPYVTAIAILLVLKTNPNNTKQWEIKRSFHVTNATALCRSKSLGKTMTVKIPSAPATKIIGTQRRISAIRLLSTCLLWPNGFLVPSLSMITCCLEHDCARTKTALSSSSGSQVARSNRAWCFLPNLCKKN